MPDPSKRTRWGPTGVGKPARGLDKSSLEQLATIVRSRDIPQDGVKEFVREVDSAVSGYRSLMGVHRDSLPGAVRRELDTAVENSA